MHHYHQQQRQRSCLLGVLRPFWCSPYQTRSSLVLSSPLAARRDSDYYLTQVDRANKQSQIAEKRQAKQQSAAAVPPTGKRKAPSDDKDLGDQPKQKKQAVQPRENIRTFHQRPCAHRRTPDQQAPPPPPAAAAGHWLELCAQFLCVVCLSVSAYRIAHRPEARKQVAEVNLSRDARSDKPTNFHLSFELLVLRACNRRQLK